MYNLSINIQLSSAPKQIDRSNWPNRLQRSLSLPRALSLHTCYTLEPKGLKALSQTAN